MNTPHNTDHQTIYHNHLRIILIIKSTKYSKVKTTHWRFDVSMRIWEFWEVAWDVWRVSALLTSHEGFRYYRGICYWGCKEY